MSCDYYIFDKLPDGGRFWGDLLKNSACVHDDQGKLLEEAWK